MNGVKIKEEPVNHDWDFLWSITFQFLYENFGEKGLLKYYKHLAGSSYYEKVIINIKEKGLKGVKKYWEESSNGEGTKYMDDLTDNKYILKVNSCSAYKYFQEENLDTFNKYCDYCKVINEEIARKSNIKYRLLNCDHKGSCGHIFFKKS